jgi:quinol monooxygenase YgiN
MRALIRLLVVAAIAWALAAQLRAQDASAVYIVSYLEAVPASQGQVGTLLKQLAEMSRKEGALRFEVIQRITEPNQFAILETWKDQAARDAHAGASHTRQFRDQVVPLLLAPIDDRLCIATTVAAPREGRGAVYVVTHIDVPPTGREAATPLIEAFAKQSRMDTGNLRFDVVHEKAKTNHFTVIDVWSSQKSEDDHQIAPRTRTFRNQIGPFAGALYDRRSYRPL